MIFTREIHGTWLIQIWVSQPTLEAKFSQYGFSPFIRFKSEILFNEKWYFTISTSSYQWNDIILVAAFWGQSDSGKQEPFCVSPLKVSMTMRGPHHPSMIHPLLLERKLYYDTRMHAIFHELFCASVRSDESEISKAFKIGEKWRSTHSLPLFIIKINKWNVTTLGSFIYVCVYIHNMSPGSSIVVWLKPANFSPLKYK